MIKNAVTELIKLQKKSKDSALKNDVITEVNKLLEYDSFRDLEILRSIGSSSNLIQAENAKGAAIELEKKEDFYSGLIFSREQIIELGVKYRLKFLRSERYKGYIDPAVAKEVKDLERNIAKSMEREQAQKRNMTIEEYREKEGETTFKFDAHELKTKFFVLAPADCFNLQKVSKYVPDPVLFYSDDNKHFRLIKKWGSDFTIFRRLRGLWFQSRPANYWYRVLAFSILGVISIPFIGWYAFLFLAILPLSGVLTYSLGETFDDFWGVEHVTTDRKF